MTTRDDGGPAYPPSIACGPAGDVYDTETWTIDRGPRLRDWFAGQIIGSLIGPLHAEALKRPGMTLEDIASEAYQLADAMLEARKK